MQDLDFVHLQFHSIVIALANVDDLPDNTLHTRLSKANIPYIEAAD